MNRTVRLSVIGVMLLSTTALGLIGWKAMNPELPPPPAPPAPSPPIVVQKEEPPQPWVCPYEQDFRPKLAMLDHINAPTDVPHIGVSAGLPASAEEVRRTLGVIPCSLSAGDSGAKVALKDRHYYPKVSINGLPVRAMVDSGASIIAFSEAFRQLVPADAKDCNSETANGKATRKCFILPKITVEGFVLHEVEASCCVTMADTLLGMSVLNRFAVSFHDGWMTLAPR
jgi:clan AA aspartic protease (TIGR02281 family)